MGKKVVCVPLKSEDILDCGRLIWKQHGTTLNNYFSKGIDMRNNNVATRRNNAMVFGFWAKELEEERRERLKAFWVCGWATPSGSVVWRYHEEAVGAFSFASCTHGY